MKYLLTGIGLTGLVLFALFVWPTKYRYDQIHRGSGISNPVRINRITGQAEILYPHGWEPAAAEPPRTSTSVDEAHSFAKYPATPASPAPNKPLVSAARAKPIPPPTGLEKLEITHFRLPCPPKGTETYGFGTHSVADGSCAAVSANVHNGSDKTLFSIVVEITVPAKEIMSRKYRLTCNEDGRSPGQGIGSYHSGDCQVDLGGDLINADDAIAFKPISADLSDN